MVHPEKTMDLSTMEHEIKLVGAALVNRNLNRWGVQNIFRSSWKDLGEVQVKWVHENLYIISAPNESVADRILSQAP